MQSGMDTDATFVGRIGWQAPIEQTGRAERGRTGQVYSAITVRNLAGLSPALR